MRKITNEELHRPSVEEFAAMPKLPLVVVLDNAPACLPAQCPKKETDRNSILVSWVPDATMKSVSCLSTAVPICCLI